MPERRRGQAGDDQRDEHQRQNADAGADRPAAKALRGLGLTGARQPQGHESRRQPGAQGHGKGAYDQSERSGPGDRRRGRSGGGRATAALASPPAIMPKANGATRLATPNPRLSSRALRAPVPGLPRRPRAALRTTMASSAIVNGASRPVPSAEKASREGREEDGDGEDQPHVVGLPQRPDRCGDRLAVAASGAARSEPTSEPRSRIPAPKSAPAKTAYAVSEAPSRMASRAAGSC